MKVKANLTAAILAFAAIGLIAESAIAERIPAKPPKEVKSDCNASGGVNFPKTGANSTYGCINSDGSGIVCGGVTKNDKKTCDTFKKAPPRLPTRGEAQKAEGGVKQQ